MAYSKQIAWDDGSNDKIYFSAPASEGNQTVKVSSDANAGNERTKTVNFNASGVSPKALTIVQLGSGADFDAWVHDGDTHLWIEILEDYQLDQKLRIRLIGTIDWGDGSTKQSVNVSTYTTFTHTYTQKGKYRIDLHPTSGTFYLGGASTSYSVMGERGASHYFRTSVLYQAEIGDTIIRTLSSYAFYYCYGLKRVLVSRKLTAFNTGVFFNCYGLQQVIFEDPTHINSCSLASNFYYCYNLQYITPLNIGSGGETLTTPARNCQSLMEFTIPSFITTIASNSFATMYGMKKLFCLPTTPPTISNANVFDSFPTGCAIMVPIGSLSNYQSASYWADRSAQMVEAAAIKFTLTNVATSNQASMAEKNGSYTTTLTPYSGTLGTVTVKMGGTDITNTAYSAGVITIANVTGNIEITATAS